MARRGNGTGSIFWHKARKRWIALIPLPNGGRKQVTTNLPHEARVGERRATLARLLQQFAEPTPKPPSPLTVQTYLEQWNRDAATAETSRKRRASLITYCIVPYLGKRLLTELSAQDIAGLLATLGQGDTAYSPRTIKEVRGFLSTALREAVRHRLIDRNPVDLVRGKLPPPRHYPLLTPAQFRQLLDAASADPDGAIVALGLLTGLRIGEAMGLRWTDFDERARTLRVDRTVNNLANSEQRVTVPKTPSSRRTVILPATALAVLQRHRAVQAKRRLAAGSAWHDRGLIFPDTAGNLARSQNIGGDHLARLLKALGLPHLRFHDLRHNAASHLLAGGVPLQVVSELLGHANPGITQRLYGHLLPGMRKVAADAMDRLFGAGGHADTSNGKTS